MRGEGEGEELRREAGGEEPKAEGEKPKAKS